MILKMKEPTNVHELHQAIRLFLIDTFGFPVGYSAGGDRPQLDLCLDEDGDVRITFEA
jgi:hypothetical protein